MLEILNKKPVAIFAMSVVLVGASFLVARGALTLNSNSLTGDGSVTFTAGSSTIIYGSSTTGYVGIGTTTPTSFFNGATGISTPPVLDVAGSLNMATASSSVTGTNLAGLYQGGTLLLWGDDTSPNAGGGNLAFGTGVMPSLTTGYRNVGIGRFALPVNTTGYENVSIGTFSMVHNTVGNDNIAIGENALANPVAALYNVAIGYFAMSNATSTAGYNVGIGYQALQGSTGSENVGIGDGAGRANSTGNNNVYIGAGAGLSATGSSSVMIGNFAGQNETGNNKLYIANSNTTRPLIYGDFASSSLGFFGRVGIGTSTPSTTLMLATTTPIVTLFDTTASGRQYQFRNGTVALGTFELFDNTSGVSRIAVTSAGNLGIGTTTPASTLQVGTPLDSTSSYFQLDSTSTVPASADCNATTSLGRMIWVPSATAVNQKLYICGYNSSGAVTWSSSTFGN